MSEKRSITLEDIKDLRKLWSENADVPKPYAVIDGILLDRTLSALVREEQTVIERDEARAEVVEVRNAGREALSELIDTKADVKRLEAEVERLGGLLGEIGPEFIAHVVRDEDNGDEGTSYCMWCGTNNGHAEGCAVLRVEAELEKKP